LKKNVIWAYQTPFFYWLSRLSQLINLQLCGSAEQFSAADQTADPVELAFMIATGQKKRPALLRTGRNARLFLKN